MWKDLPKMEWKSKIEKYLSDLDLDLKLETKLSRDVSSCV